jgi:hypothetical protein
MLRHMLCSKFTTLAPLLALNLTIARSSLFLNVCFNSSRCHNSLPFPTLKAILKACSWYKLCSWYKILRVFFCSNDKRKSLVNQWHVFMIKWKIVFNERAKSGERIREI